MDDLNFGIASIPEYINAHWGSHARVISRNNNFYVLKFDTLEDLHAILHNGPYAIDGALFVLTRWRPNVSAENIRIHKILVWIRLYGLPTEYFNPVGGNKISIYCERC